MTRLDALATASGLILDEGVRAITLHRPFSSQHEAYAVLLEELDEAFDEIKRNQKQLAVHEMIQVGAMALRFVAEFKAGLEVDDGT